MELWIVHIGLWVCAVLLGLAVCTLHYRISELTALIGDRSVVDLPDLVLPSIMGKDRSTGHPVALRSVASDVEFILFLSSDCPKCRDLLRDLFAEAIYAAWSGQHGSIAVWCEGGSPGACSSATCCVPSEVQVVFQDIEEDLRGVPLAGIPALARTAPGGRLTEITYPVQSQDVTTVLGTSSSRKHQRPRRTRIRGIQIPGKRRLQRRSTATTSTCRRTPLTGRRASAQRCLCLVGGIRAELRL